MSRYWERTVPSALSSSVVCLWSRSATEDDTAPFRVVPDGCTDLIWVPATGQLLVAGPDTGHQLATARPGRMVGIRFGPGVGPAVLANPGHTLRDLRIPLNDLWPRDQVDQLTEQLALAAGPAEVDAVLVRAVAARLRQRPPDPAAPAIVAGVRRGEPARAVADQLGLSERQLHRRCLAAFGYGPKTLHRVLRFHGALDLARAGVPFADVAATAGYADQAHLSREVKALSGISLGALVGSGTRSGG
ncbi:helix-turn-helix domain-containing protein [Goodfellowiella coeruleoviolacea]|uniref:helix-turn-helix domain-containing protein n=1 Tax=Goodfellowiella coeruleoviolacea TaxID=334858 RepID=UPI0020A462F9|nr:helix-turn-helix transcriptional regulator [Goodfellowiella coeruleoviolacea]